MKKGFTLVEFLGVIILLAIITLLVLPNIIGSVKGSKDKVDNTTLEMIYSASDLYVSNHPDYFPKDNRNKFTIELTDLITDKLLEGPIKLFDGTDITDKKCVQVIYQDEYKYELKNAGECEEYILAATYLTTGDNFNAAIKTLANNTSMTYASNDTTVKTISFYSRGDLPEGYTLDTLEALANTDVSNDSSGSIKAYYDGNGNIYVYSEGKITANEECVRMFINFSGLTALNLNKLDTSKVTNMQGMFRKCSSLTTLDLSNFYTSKVTNMQYMFYDCSSLTALDLSSFNTSKVKTMNFMFGGCSGLGTLNLSSFNTSNVTEMRNMFGRCSSLTTLDLSSFNTSNVIAMQSMFAYCSNLSTLNLNSFNTSNVTSMGAMFFGCSSLTTLDLSSFDTSKVTLMTEMFESCSNLTELDLSSFNTSSVTNMDQMFWHCSNLTTLDLSNFNTSNVVNVEYMFAGCTSLTNASISSLNNWNINKVTNFTNMFQSVTNPTRPNWNGTWDSNGTFTKAS